MSDLDARVRADLLRAIAELAASEPPCEDAALYRAIVAHMPAKLTVIDPAGHILWKNQNPEMIGRSLFDLMQVDDQADARAAVERVLRTGRSDRFIGFGPGMRGARSRYENWLAPISASDQIIALALISRDVSEEWELYEALRDREQRLSLVLRAAGMGTWRFDFPTKTVEFDEHARVVYGLTVGRLDSRTFTSTHIHPDDRVEVDKRALDSAISRRPYVSHNRIIRTDGQVRWVEITGSPILDESGQLVALMGTVADITERRELENRARQAQRLDAVGSLTAGIAHNFNNVLAAIIPALSLIERDVSPRSLSLVRGASLATERAADLVRQLMTFAGRNLTRARTVESPCVLVERTVALCRSTFDRVIELRVTFEAALPAVLVDVGQIEQALLNLLLNARDAVSEPGRSSPMVHVRVTSLPHPDALSQRMIAIVVEDNGPGVPDDLRERIFDPFFTTKPVGSGTGLGLATAYAIAREHGGGLSCGGEVGKGARFMLLIPAVDDAPVADQPVARATVRSQGTVLVVDDDPFVRETVERVLVDAGFIVHIADSAERAMTELAIQPAIDAVLLDLNMPGASWRGVVGAIRSNHPSTRVIAFTGGIIARDGSLDGWLAKPAQPEAIVDAINQAIARPKL
jgi:PAS domain S-box-containing protein